MRNNVSLGEAIEVLRGWGDSFIEIFFIFKLDRSSLIMEDCRVNHLGSDTIRLSTAQCHLTIDLNGASIKHGQSAALVNEVPAGTSVKTAMSDIQINNSYAKIMLTRAVITRRASP